ncbi:hypothetical protein BDK51DRAFT_38833 [Blyttiomyces helicus]|uniref:Uncharacterized protein n=1 Tax=Blyttiomyces helicus TaxID=388810 RepID=A0A4P9WME9_9FUNG|nr:hypothetical protein BDK51DRAFT_38833 [Blyttiomyces helicus]|eukprot:RKO91896.1 hypothetical protein BDK51DRAFT_38833 [Blyttiomyces helicus]
MDVLMRMETENILTYALSPKIVRASLVPRTGPQRLKAVNSQFIPHPGNGGKSSPTTRCLPSRPPALTIVDSELPTRSQAPPLANRLNSFRSRSRMNVNVQFPGSDGVSAPPPVRSSSVASDPLQTSDTTAILFAAPAVRLSAAVVIPYPAWEGASVFAPTWTGHYGPIRLTVHSRDSFAQHTSLNQPLKTIKDTVAYGEQLPTHHSKVSRAPFLTSSNTAGVSDNQVIKERSFTYKSGLGSSAPPPNRPGVGDCHPFSRKSQLPVGQA